MAKQVIASGLPEGFIYLRDINPTIIENLRYNTDENFIGKRMIGYRSNKVILTEQAASALSRVQDVKKIDVKERKLEDGQKILFLDDGTIDMGTSFDLLGEASHHDSNLIKLEFLKRRNYLRRIMGKNGFNEYKKEWWHYTLKDEPFP